MNMILNPVPDLAPATEYRLIFGHDAVIAEWGFRASGGIPIQFNCAVGIMDRRDNLCGAFIFTGFNGSEAEIHYYGPGTLKRYIVRDIFRIALLRFNLNRLTVRTRKESMARGVQKLGAIYECTLKRVYGPTDDTIHAARQFVWFRDQMENLAEIRKHCDVR
jgi:hypothetical protein